MTHRNRSLAVGILLLGACLAPPQRAWAQADPTDEVRTALKGVVESYNKHDAAAVAAAWAEGAVYTEPGNGVLIEGRAAIQDWYAQIFKDQPQATLKANVSAVDFEGDSHAFVRGTAEVTAPEADPDRSSFIAELVKIEGQWLIAIVEESDPDPIADLDWLVGSWKDDGEGPSIESTFAWEGDGRLLVRKFTVTGEDGKKRSGTQYIAGDAATGKLHSWVFDSEGAVAQGEWSAKDDHWAIHWRVTLPDGRAASATQVLKPVDEDTFEVKWSDVDVDGDLRPSTDAVTVRRGAAAAASVPTSVGGTDHE